MQKRTIDKSLRDDVLERARGVTDLLKAAAPRIEATRELPPDVLKAMHDARLFRLLLPASLGGDEIDLETHAMALETIARGDASTAWVMSQGSGCSMSAAFLAPEVAERWFRAPTAVLAWGAGIQGKAVAVDGGYRVTGTWTFNSGSRHATLLGGHSFVYDADGSRRLRPDGRPQDRTMLFARSKAEIDDVWDVVGLRGTGSDTIKVVDLFVPAEDTIDRDSRAECREPGTLYKFSTTLAYGVGFSALMLGIAQSMLDELTNLAMTKTPRGATMSLRESPVFQTELAQFQARCEAARAYLHATVRDVWRDVGETGEITIAQRARMKLTTTWVINHCFEVIKDCYRAAGQSAIHPKGPFERRMRDAMTASQQTQARASNYITVGRTLLGLEPDNMSFL
ncbi:MAG: acyl-CoA dehydrogenase family protein [Hyphomicrobiaceae bacterium]